MPEIHVSTADMKKTVKM